MHMDLIQQHYNSIEEKDRLTGNKGLPEEHSTTW